MCVCVCNIRIQCTQVWPQTEVASMGSRGKYKTWCGIADRIGWASFPFICGSLYWKLHSPRGGTDHCSSECRYDTFNASWVEAPYHNNNYYVNYFTVHSSFVNSVLVYTSDVWLSHACITHSHRSPENEWQIRSECQTTDTPAAYIQTYGGRDVLWQIRCVSYKEFLLWLSICMLRSVCLIGGVYMSTQRPSDWFVVIVFYSLSCQMLAIPL